MGGRLQPLPALSWLRYRSFGSSTNIGISSSDENLDEKIDIRHDAFTNSDAIFKRQLSTFLRFRVIKQLNKF